MSVPPIGEKVLMMEEADHLKRSTKKLKEGDPGTVGNGVAATSKRSFKQILVWGNKAESEVIAKGTIDQVVLTEEEEWSDDDDMTIEESSIPSIDIVKDQKCSLRHPWRFSVIVRVLGRFVNFNVLQQRLFNLWHLDDDSDMIDLGFGYYVVKFSDKKDLTWVLSGGPWKIMDHYLLVQRWQPNFKPSTASVGKTVVWVRLPELPREYFNADLLMEVGRLLGKPIKLDANTSLASRGKFARLCVE